MQRAPTIILKHEWKSYTNDSTMNRTVEAKASDVTNKCDTLQDPPLIQLLAPNVGKSQGSLSATIHSIDTRSDTLRTEWSFWKLKVNDATAVLDGSITRLARHSHSRYR